MLIELVFRIAVAKRMNGDLIGGGAAGVTSGFGRLAAQGQQGSHAKIRDAEPD